MRHAARALCAARAHAGPARLPRHRGLRLRAALPARGRGMPIALPPVRRGRRRARGGLHPRDADRRDRAAALRAGTEAAAPTRPILEVSGLTKHFTSRAGCFAAPHFTAVKDVGFALRQNEFVGIVGESGSGKSTLARLIVGLETPTDGRIAIAGQDVDGTRGCRRASPPPRPDGVPGPAVRVESAPPRRQHRDPAARGGRAILGGAARARRPAAARDRPAARSRDALSGPALRRAAPARQHRARALRRAAHPDRRRDRVRARRLGAGAAPEPARRAAPRARFLDAVHLARPLGGALSVRPRAGDVRGEVVESGPTEQVFAAPAHDYTRTLLAAVPPDDPAEVWQGLAGRTS